jgi:glucose/arabinose dehydrogenase
MRPRLVLVVLALAVALSLAACGSAGADKLALKQIGKFENPVYIAGAPGYPKLLFVVEQQGEIVVLKDGRRQARPFLDLRGRVDYEGERGLLSVAFPPDYKASGDFYVYYVDKRGSLQIDEYRRASPT